MRWRAEREWSVPRDEFSRAIVDRLAKRVGMKCSCPDCRAPTSGPDADEGVTNTGVAAHIAAASAGGARYDESMTADERAALANGIWLCQSHAKLIDDDEITYPIHLLREWKETAEHMAALEARGFEVRRALPFAKLEEQAPKLIEEMREDLRRHPLIRQIIVLPNKRVGYNPGHTPFCTYYLEDHPYLMSMVTIMEHVGAIYDVAFNQVPRYNFTEAFVSFLIGESPSLPR
jgi:hypothetical protein